MSTLEWLDDIKKCLDMVGVGWVESCAHEADDVIATLASRSAGQPRSILSMDKDFYQLIDDEVTVLNTVKKRSRAMVDRAEVVDRFGVEPWQWCDFRALTGEPSDNIPGVRGIGRVRAARILADGLILEEARAAGRLVGAAERVWEKVLAVTAHPDDAELWMGGPLAWHARYAAVTIAAERVDEQRAVEAMLGAEILGAQVELIDRHGEQSCVDLLRRLKPEILIVHPRNDMHHDHRRVAETALAAVPLQSLRPDFRGGCMRVTLTSH